MLKKKKKNAKKTVINSLSQKSLEQSAAAYYNLGDYKNALPRYERAYKVNPNDLTKERLINCFLERAKQLREKSLFVEASAMLWNLQKLAPDALPVNDYLACFVNAHYYDKACKFCKEHSIDIASIPRELAVRMICYEGTSQLITSSPSHTFYQDVATFQHVLAQFDSALDNESMLSELKKISLRSPLKDLRLVINALLIFQARPTDALALAKEINSTSPFFAIAHVIIVAGLPLRLLFQALSSLTTLQLSLLQQLKGWGDKQLATLVMAVKVLVNQDNKAKKIQFILSLQSVLPEELIKQLSLSLYDGLPTTWKLYGDRFNKELFARAKQEALAAEDDEDPWHSIEPWNKCIQIIKKSDKFPPEFIGMIRLRQFELISEGCCPEHTECIDWLIESLDYLPQRKETYLKICNWYAEDDQKKLHLKWLDKMHKQFPADIEVILNAAKISLQRGKFTQAINALKKALALDSINPKVKKLLARCYIEKALYDIGRTNYKAALQDLAEAKSIQQYLTPPYLVEICESLLAYRQGDFPAMQERLKLVYQQSGNSLFANYLLQHSASINLTLNLASFDQQLTWDLGDQTDFLALKQCLHHIVDYFKNNDITRWLDINKNEVFKKIIVQTVKGRLVHDDYSVLCSLLMSLRFYETLAVVANAALKKHKNSALFNYYNIQAKIEDDVSKLSDAQYDRLIDDYDSLPDEGQNSTKGLIEALLDKVEESRGPSSNMFPPELRQLFDSLFN